MHSYLLQLHTGSFLKQHTTIEEIKKKLTNVVTSLPIKGVIVGWSIDQKLNEDILAYFHSYQIPCYLWLPVFSELDALKPVIPITNISGKQGNHVQVIEDESFHFFCPSHHENITYVKEVYEEHFSMLAFDGVFLDKIRYPSFANGYEEGFGCFCDTCRSRFEKEGVSVSYLEEKIFSHDASLLQGVPTKQGQVQFSDPNIHHFYKTRAAWITEAIEELIHYFHNQKKIVGLDLFAPFFAYHCGQDIETLSAMADFIKPMMYRHTLAPAGMQYEYDAYRSYFPSAQEARLEPTLETSLQQQFTVLKDAHCSIYPGIEINPIKDICLVDKQKLIDNLTYFHSTFDTLVCCWNCLLLKDDFLELLQKY